MTPVRVSDRGMAGGTGASIWASAIASLQSAGWADEWGDDAVPVILYRPLAEPVRMAAKSAAPGRGSAGV